ncbi:uncharacterized protein OCT59_015496 [Rhizophagus irregularis]|uniref:Uncharacterized protein n=2 Tax=Rhizophagus irregularis TaxID=588596 RepID=A0A015N1T9_RHIIW|nr:hypothetical protein GLOIN_2v1769931 [Rhizophagus irregularis DAOM 181602=DAOM 197198]EXX73073.1 hypothetical protein RirG_063480 [Rhizophagus irregularis DAOM 197198w]POG75691.1 hypothetical protein GLOIN_2v1769931 [Rhizophagus irregularis DAOM 181602=DAOM 197198]UZO23152.1 hypothetical protein OCT59_015496 [Rhizophagus irregularis]CAB4463672.1 unnamed protein product [Rhizophagus irregularis]|eukprot:XP_025182557.1 hypothetical protein GLOIN_2v1769931 [Rhizophagus irregularis DAOM 181602=DAOM 197198]
MANEEKENISDKLSDREQEVIIIKHDDKNVGVTTLSYNRGVDGSSSDSSTTNDNKYHIAICQDGEICRYIRYRNSSN